jgi:hypothetical protein
LVSVLVVLVVVVTTGVTAAPG